MKQLANQKITKKQLDKIRKLKPGNIIYQFIPAHISRSGVKQYATINTFVVYKVNKSSISVLKQYDIDWQIDAYPDKSYKELFKLPQSHGYIEFENVYTNRYRAIERLESAFCKEIEDFELFAEKECLEISDSTSDFELKIENKKRENNK